MSPELPFRPMVDVEGHEARLCVCPLDEGWQEHLAALYARDSPAKARRRPCQSRPSAAWT